MHYRVKRRCYNLAQDTQMEMLLPAVACSFLSHVNVRSTAERDIKQNFEGLTVSVEI